MYQQEIANCISVNQTGTRGVAALLIKGRQRREPNAGHAFWWSLTLALRARRNERKQRTTWLKSGDSKEADVEEKEGVQ